MRFKKASACVEIQSNGMNFSVADWKYSSGFVTADMLKAHLPAPGSDTLILMCGPPPMIQFACQPNLDKLGYPKSCTFAY